MTGIAFPGIAIGGVGKSGIARAGVGGAGLGFVGQRGGISPQVAQYITRLTAGESTAFKTAAAGFINGMGAAWGRTDGLYFLDTTLKANSLLNVKSALYPFVQTGGLPDGQFTAGLGWTGDGVIGHYLDNGCDPTVEVGLNFTLNAASVGGRVSAGAKNVAQFLFGNANCYAELDFTDTNAYWRAHNATDLTIASPAVLTGVWNVLRTGVGNAQFRKDAANLATSVAATTAMKNTTLRSLGSLDASTLTVRALWFGAHTQADADLIGTLLATFFP